MEASNLRSTIAAVLLLLLISIASATRPAARPDAAPRPQRTSAFIRASCRSTRYPAVCEQCLSVYAPAVHHSPRQLAHAALSVSAARARDVSSFVSRISASSGSKSPHSRGGGAVHDCLETLADGLDRLHSSVKELNRMGRYGTPRFNWHVGNVQTWVSAALTDENTCLDSLAQDARADPAVKAAIRKKIVAVAQVTSNALALVNRLQDRN